MGRHIIFYKTISGSSPIEDFLDSLPGKAAQKIAWVLSVVEELEIIPARYFKKIHGVSNSYEARIDFGGNTYRLLGFVHKENFIVFTNGFMKKDNKIPKGEIDLCSRRSKDFLDRGEIQ